jgi:hypothetical protein
VTTIEATPLFTTNGALTMTQAADLLEVPALRAASNRLKTLEAEVASLKQAAEGRAKGITAPVSGSPGRSNGTGYPLRPVERAFAQAEQALRR